MNSRSSFKSGKVIDNHPVKGKIPENSQSNECITQINYEMSGVTINPETEGWEVFAKKTKSKGVANTSSSWGTSKSGSKLWAQQDMQKTNTTVNSFSGKSAASNRPNALGSKGHSNNANAKMQTSSLESVAPVPSVPPVLVNGWSWAAKNPWSSSQMNFSGDGNSRSISEYASSEGQVRSEVDQVIVQSDDDDDDFVESDDDFSDEYDSDVSEKSHETKRKSKWYKTFFETLDSLTVEQINETTRQWHCPACKDGPGAIDWYRGLQPLMTHAKTKGSTRVKLHRTFSELLEEELYRRGASIIAPGEAFGKWKGLRENNTDREIVWPPMVVVMNTQLEKDEDEKWIGMGNQELIEYFSNYDAVRARHSYGPNGHRGMSVLIFEASAVGYMEAERLHKHFIQQCTDRDAWDRRRVLFLPGGKRQLYGFLARKEDLDYFNQHSHGKTRLKFEMKSYQEMVVSHMKQMNEDNQQLAVLKKEVFKQEQQKKTLQESVGALAKRLHETEQENRIVRERTMIQHAQNKEEMDCLEIFFKEQIAKVHKATERKEQLFEKLLQEERLKAKQRSAVSSGTKEERELKEEEVMNFIRSQVKEIEEFEAAREKLINAHEEKKVEMKRRHLKEEVDLEKDFDNALTTLMKKYSPDSFASCSSA